MSARGKIALLLLAASLPPTVSGCATNAQPRRWYTGGTTLAQAVQPQPGNSAAATAREDSQGQAATAIAQHPVARETTAQAQPPQASSRRVQTAQPAASTQLAAEEGIDPQALGDVLAELDAIGALDADAKRQLLEDLRSTRPALWRPMVRQFRAALTYRKRLEAQRTAQVAASQTAPQTPKHSSSHKAVVPEQPNPERADDPVARLAARTAPTPTDAPPSTEPAATTAPVVGPPSEAGVPPVPKTLAAHAAPPVGTPLQPSTTPSTGAAASPPSVLLVAEAPASLASASTGTVPTTEDPSLATAAPAEAAEVDSGPPIVISLDPATDPVAHTGRPPLGPPDTTDGATRPAAVSSVDAAPAVAAAQLPAVPPQTALADPALPVLQAAHVVPSGLEETADWEANLQRTIQGLEGLTQGAPRDAEQARLHAMLRILYLTAERRGDALKPIEGLGPAQQDFWTSQLYGLSTLLDTERTPDPGLRASEARRHLNEASQRLGELSTLSVRNLAFCREVKSFGVYTPFEDNKFEPDQELLLYVEIDNFKSEETEKGFHTALRSSYQILDSRGTRVGERDFGLTEEDCLRQRRDFFMRYFIYLPERIYPGQYTLQLTIEDTLSQKIGQASIELQIAEP